MSPVQTYFSQQASSVRGRAHAWLKARESRAVLKAAGSMNGARVLDLGAGDGFYARLGLKAGASEITCVDFCEHFFVNLEDDQIHTSTENVESSDIDARGFQHVFCLGLLEFLDEPRPFLERLGEKLEKGTRVTLLYPPRGGFFTRLYQRFHRKNGIPVKSFKPDEVQAWMWSRGLTLVERKKPHPYAVVETYVVK